MTTAGQTLNELQMNPRSAKPLWWQRFRAYWNATFEAAVPVGYEDEAGFHYDTEARADFGHQDRC